ncbi:MAG TPA: S24 family peptidase [Gammaproteobacteria bacterium]|jgi:SOS-response transcriptional repressor LexA
MSKTQTATAIETLVRLKKPHLLKRDGSVNQAQLAAEAKLEQPTVGRILSGESKRPYPQTIEALAAYFDVTIGQVMGTEELLNASTVASPMTSVPLISWVQAGKGQEVMDIFTPGVADKWVDVPKKLGPGSFALRVHGDSMEPKFPEGCIIICDPGVQAAHGKYVVVRTDHDNEATFKQLVVDGGKKYLKPINPRYEIVELSLYAHIAGVVVWFGGEP